MNLKGYKMQLKYKLAICYAILLLTMTTVVIFGFEKYLEVIVKWLSIVVIIMFGILSIYLNYLKSEGEDERRKN